MNFKLLIPLGILALIASCSPADDKKKIKELEDEVARLKELVPAEKEVEGPGLTEMLRDESANVPCDLGKRKPSDFNILDSADVYLNYKRKFKLPKFKNKQVLSSMSYSFGLCSVKDLIADIDANPGLNVTGLRVQMYFQPGKKKDKNLIDAILVPVTEDGSYVPFIPTGVKSDGSTPGFQEGGGKSLMLNTSNGCPDVCDPGVGD